MLADINKVHVFLFVLLLANECSISIPSFLIHLLIWALDLRSFSYCFAILFVWCLFSVIANNFFNFALQLDDS